MQRIPPSEQIRKQLDDLLNNGLAGQENPIGTLVQLDAQLVVQELLEQETTEELGRGYYPHRPPRAPRSVRPETLHHDLALYPGHYAHDRFMIVS